VTGPDVQSEAGTIVATVAAITAVATLVGSATGGCLGAWTSAWTSALAAMLGRLVSAMLGQTHGRKPQQSCRTDRCRKPNLTHDAPLNGNRSHCRFFPSLFPRGHEPCP